MSNLNRARYSGDLDKARRAVRREILTHVNAGTLSSTEAQDLVQEYKRLDRACAAR